MKRSVNPIWVCGLLLFAAVGCEQPAPPKNTPPAKSESSTTPKDSVTKPAAESQAATSGESTAKKEAEKTEASPAGDQPVVPVVPPESKAGAAESKAPAADSATPADQPAKDSVAAAGENQSAGVTPPAETPPAEASPTETPPAETPAADAPPAAPAADKVRTGDWTMWGGTPHRNMVSTATGLTLDFDIEKNENLAWVAKLGSQTYGNPVVHQGKVFVGTNNGAEYRPKHKGDRGILLCFAEADGKFLWQLTREKLPIGQVMDWPEQGICSVPFVEGDRMWVVTNRCELLCLDTEGFLDGENDGEYTTEVDAEPEDADIVWSLDMLGDELGVFPHNLATSSPVVHGDLVFLVTGNGVDEAHLELPSPRAPSFLAVNKNTGKVVWEKFEPGDRILHGQWSSPALGEVNGKMLVFFPGGDGHCYAYTADDAGELVWDFDLNPKETKWELGGAGTRNNIIGTPVFYDGSVFLGVGQDPEHGEGTGHFYRIDASKTGDISPELGEINSPGTPNPNSGSLWHYGGVDEDGSVTGEAGESIFRRTLSTAAIHGDLVFISDLSGYLHCLDIKTGKRHWMYDTKGAIWGSPFYVDGKVFLGNEDGRLFVFRATAEKAEVLKQFDMMNYSSVYSTPVIANGKMFLTDRSRLYCIPIQ